MDQDRTPLEKSSELPINKSDLKISSGLNESASKRAASVADVGAFRLKFSFKGIHSYPVHFLNTFSAISLVNNADAYRDF